MSLWQCSKCLRTYPFEQYVKLESKWVNEEMKDLGRELICTCGKPFLSDKWNLKTTDSSGYTVSTAHLEMAHQSNLDFSSDQIMWYETMIYDKNMKFLDFQARYRYKKAATEGHELAVKLLPKIIESPEKYPTDIFSQFFNKVKE